MSDEETGGGRNTSESVQRQGEERRQDAPRPGIRIAELGRMPVEVQLDEGETVTIQELIDDGHLSADEDVQIYVNMRQVADRGERVSNGANIVTVRKIVAGYRMV